MRAKIISATVAIWTLGAVIDYASATERTLTNCHPQPGMGRRVAVVVGNGAYNSSTFGPLVNPKYDASDMAAAFCALGFAKVNSFVDADLSGLAQAMSALNSDGAGADMIVFFYSGHGIEFQNDSYLVPAGYSGPLDELPTLGVPLDRIRQNMRSAKADALRLVLLDACRDLVHKGSTGYGFGSPGGLDRNTLVVYAAAEGASALAVQTMRNSYFTAATLQHLKNHASLAKEDIFTVFRDVAEDVIRATQGAQQPAFYVQVFTPFYFLPGPGGQAASPIAVASNAPAPTGAVAMGPEIEPPPHQGWRGVAPQMPAEAETHRSLAPDVPATRVTSEAAFPTAGFVFPDSNVALLTPDELASKSKAELDTARNEIYARHGYRFRRQELTAYFENEPWYRPWGRIGDQESARALFNDIENKNVDAIVRYERTR